VKGRKVKGRKAKGRKVKGRKAKGKKFIVHCRKLKAKKYKNNR